MVPKSNSADKTLLDSIIKQYLPFDSYQKAVDILEAFAKIVLFSFVNNSTGKRDEIIKNFIARSIVALKGVLKLWEIEDYPDCWVLNRCILDRLFHLKALVKNDDFELFDKWSFQKQYEHTHRLRSDPNFNKRIPSEVINNLDSYRDKYLAIKKERINWRRPKAEDMAKDLDLDFLYHYGYDYASAFVHPMANDGQEDFLRLTKLNAGQIMIDQRSILNNSCLAVTVLIQVGLNSSDLAWRRIIFNFLEDFRSLLSEGSKRYIVTFCKIGSLGPNVDFCKKVKKSEYI